MRISGNPKIYASNRCGGDWFAIAAVSHTHYFGFFFYIKNVLILLTAQNAKKFHRNAVKVDVIFVKSRVHLF